ncbi:hypothetical protein GLYMA_10G010151v4 [Glycine max]|nr:hypothetical protein GLYMA_10G010151v4 [Glycine max]KAH1136176.1 hypothetical protein GYH30_026591 [Glycine max]
MSNMFHFCAIWLLFPFFLNVHLANPNAYYWRKKLFAFNLFILMNGRC